MRLHIARLAAVVLATAAAGLGLVTSTSAPATAAACPSASGVTVVVDHGSLGGGVEQVCNQSGGGNAAASNFTGAGFSLTYVQQQPGFVCRINGQPASDPCVRTPPSNAYWGLWWSDGRSGSWTYSSLGAGSLTVPDGGYVAFAWQSGSQNPRTSPPPRTPAIRPRLRRRPRRRRPVAVGWRWWRWWRTRRRPRWRERRRAQLAHTDGEADPQAVGQPDRRGHAVVDPLEQPGAGRVHVGPDERVGRRRGHAHGGSDDAAVPAESGSTSAVATASEPGSTPVDAPDASPDESGAALPAWVVPLVLVVLAAGGATYLLRRRRRTSP